MNASTPPNDRDALTAASTHPVAHYPLPDFKKCGNCGAEARRWVTWDNTLGWCCSKCGGCDSDE